MKRRVVFINAFMLMGIIVLAVQFVSAWRSFEEDGSLAQIFSRAGVEGRGTDPLNVEPMSPSPPFSDFIVISERTLFAEDRRPPSVEEEDEDEEGDPEAEAAETGPNWLIRPILRGASNVGGKVAILTVFPGNRATERTDIVHIGDDVLGFTVAEIDARSVTLRWQDREEIIDMADAEGEQVASGAAPGKAAISVITVGSAPAALAKTTAKGAGQQGSSSLQVVVAGQESPAEGAGNTGRQGGPTSGAPVSRTRDDQRSGARRTPPR